MYGFKIKKEHNGYRFQLGSINILLDGFEIRGNKHWITNPHSATAFFKVNGRIYGVDNHIRTFKTAESFFDTMQQQYTILS
jgi:hypothetical protein